MIGRVDERGRALLDIRVGNKLVGECAEVTAWIDTAFDGHLFFSLELIQNLQLDSLVETEAILADGSTVTLDTYICFVEWFGEKIPLQVIANDGRFPLLGTGLLDQHVLHVDYRAKTVALE
jgi:clan AA aspartic protease